MADETLTDSQKRVFMCSNCSGVDPDVPFQCPKDGELDDWVEDDEYFEDGWLYWDGYCHEAEDSILLRQSEVMLDAANTAHYVEQWAKEQGWDIEVEWTSIVRNGKWVDRVGVYTDNDDKPYHVLGQYYTECCKALKKYMESKAETTNE